MDSLFGFVGIGSVGLSFLLDIFGSISKMLAGITLFWVWDFPVGSNIPIKNLAYYLACTRLESKMKQTPILLELLSSLLLIFSFR